MVTNDEHDTYKTAEKKIIRKPTPCHCKSGSCQTHGVNKKRDTCEDIDKPLKNCTNNYIKNNR